MDTRIDSLPHDDGDTTAAFRKPSSDGSSRKYRRRALDDDGSSSSDGIPERNQSPNSKHPRGDSRKVDDLSHARKDDRRESDRGRYGRGGDSHRHERYSRDNNHASKRDDYSKHGRDADENGRKYRMSPPRSSRDSRSGHHSDRRRVDAEHSRSRNDSDRHSRGKYSFSEHKSNSNEKGEDLSSDRAVSGKRHTDSRSEDKEKDYVRSSDGLDEKQGPHRSFSDRHSRDERREHEDHVKSPRDRSDGKCLVTEDRDTHSKKLKGFSSENFTHGNANAEEKQTSSLKPAIGVSNQGLTLQAHSKETGISGVDAAKVAAMQAAELVNKNLVGTGFLTTDQKKKLLWGKKKSTAAEETAHRWDSALIGDRERQEKFNKLMSLRLRWYIWGIVGCEREYRKPRTEPKQARSSSREAERAATGSREAIHSRTEEERWTNSGVRSLNLSGKSHATYSCCLRQSGECCGIYLLYFTHDKLLVTMSSMRVRSKFDYNHVLDLVSKFGV